MIRRYYVAPCADENAKRGRTYDVMERALCSGKVRRDEATAVSNHDTRREAEVRCRERNRARAAGEPDSDLAIANVLATPPQRWISSGYAELDAALGGGYPVGRVVEIFGPATSALLALAQRALDACADGYALMCAPGVCAAGHISSQPATTEQVLGGLTTLVRLKKQMVVVNDLAAIGDDDAYGKNARLMAQLLRALTALAHRNGTTILFVTQLRERTGDAALQPQGQALKYYASVRLDVRGRVVKVVKNKHAPPFKTVELPEVAP